MHYMATEYGIARLCGKKYVSGRASFAKLLFFWKWSQWIKVYNTLFDSPLLYAALHSFLTQYDYLPFLFTTYRLSRLQWLHSLISDANNASYNTVDFVLKASSVCWNILVEFPYQQGHGGCSPCTYRAHATVSHLIFLDIISTTGGRCEKSSFCTPK